MRNILLSFLLVLLTASAAIAGPTQKADADARKAVMDAVKNNSSALGRQFVVAFPPNYDPNYTKQVLDIYVASGNDGTVCIKNDFFSLERCLPLEGGTITTFSTQDETSSWAWELWDAERPLEMGFEISADVPISVYVMISKRATSEGYMAIPVSAWGNKYMHNNYYHWVLNSWSFSSGFVIIANDNDTQVRIEYKGKGQGYGQTTEKGKGIGDVERITLKKHQVYMVLTDSDLQHGFDLSGTIITSTKPIGVISFHQISWVPAQCGAGDNIVAMMPPIEAWGKEYATIELDRGMNKGDYVRVLAAEDDTELNVTTYDIATSRVLKSWDVVINAGEMWDYNGDNIFGHCGDEDITGVMGLSVYKADKPIYVQQYSYSSQWDCVPGGLWDPFTFPITAREQYTDATIFQTPYNRSSDNEFNNNFFNIIAIGDTNDPANHRRMMQSIVLDGQQLTARDASFGVRQIPGTDYFWGRFPVTKGPHFIKADADTKFGAYIYGFSWFDSYAWPAATNYADLTKVDTLPPVVEITEVADECGVFRVHATELRNALEGDPIQEDTGFGYPPRDTLNENFSAPIMVDATGREITMDGFPFPGVYDYWWEFRVEDLTQDAKIIGYFLDQSGNPGVNFTPFELEYFADGLMIEPDVQDFGEVKVGTTSEELKFDVSVDSEEFSGIESIELFYNTVFEITRGADAPANMAQGDIHEVYITYSPTAPYQETEYGMDIDTLIVRTGCAEFKAIVIGQGVQSSISISDFLNNTVRPNEQICTTDKTTGNIAITNFGTDNVDDFGIIKIENVLTGEILWDVAKENAETDWVNIDGFIPEFTITPIVEIADIDVQPRVGDDPTRLEIATVCFEHDQLEEFRYEVTFKSSTEEGDHVSIWEGNVIDASLAVNSLVWGPKRVGTHNIENNEVQPDERNRAMVTISNTGNGRIRVTGVSVEDIDGNPIPHFVIDTDRNNALPNNEKIYGKAAGMHLCPELNPDCDENLETTTVLKVPIKFTPKDPALADIQGRLKIDFVNPSGNQQTTGTVYASLNGSSFLPALDPIVEGDFDNAVFVGQTSDETRKIDLASVGDLRGLTINSVRVGDDNSPIQPITDLTQLAGTMIDLNESETVEFSFAPTAEGTFTQYLIIEHDGDRGTETVEVPVITTNSDNLSATTMAYAYSNEDLDFGSISQCVINNPLLNVVLDNDGELDNDGDANDAELEFVSIQFVDPTMDQYFTFNPPAQGTMVPLNSSLDIPVTFRANEHPAGLDLVAEYTITYNVTDDAQNTLTETTEVRTISGSTFGYEITFNVDSPNAPFMPGQKVYGNGSGAMGQDKNSDIWVSTVNSGNGNIWADNDITTLDITIVYDSKELAPIDMTELNAELGNIIPANSIIAGWEVDNLIAQPSMNYPEMHELILSLSGANKIQNDGLILSMPFTTLLHDDLAATATLENISFGNICSDETPGELVSNIELEYCESTQRGVIINNAGVTTSIAPISPNPISTGTFEVDYSISYGGYVTMEITNVEGKVVDVPVQESLEGGDHSVIVSTSYLPSGQLYLTLKANGETITQPIVIVK